MIPELGQYVLILALVMAGFLAVVPMVGASTGNVFWMSFARPLAKSMFLFMSISMLCLAYAFATDDFSVKYVAENSNSALPIYYKISAVWGGHEGSLLLWVFILTGWTAAVAIKSDGLPLDIVARVLSVLGMIGVGFASFTLITSSPFERLLTNTPLEGGDLNPLLQDFGLIVHPPLLYMGYVGFSVAFAFAIAALLSGKLDVAWSRWTRPWTNVAWAFLTIGITLGSWWAYYELGWGGWWFWDPVENASFMPWLVGTALVHSLAVTEKRGLFKSWTLLLAILTFSLSLLGTFLVRSGVLTSVHSFAADPERGAYILVLLAIAVGGSLLLYAIKAYDLKSEANFELVSRETLLMINNVLLVIICAMVLIGTLYPLVVDAMGAGKISVGPPYFNALFVPFSLILAFFMGIGVSLRWKKSNFRTLAKQLIPALLLALFCGISSGFLVSDDIAIKATIALVLAFWVIFSLLIDVFSKVKNSADKLVGLAKLPLSYWSMQLAHLGLVITLVGVALVASYSQERDIRMQVGDVVEMSDYSFEFKGVNKAAGPNYSADVGTILVLKNQQFFAQMYPEKRFYPARGSVMTEADIDAGVFADIFVALGEPLADGAWSVRLQYKPFIRWVWFGGVMMMFAGLLSAFDRRYSRKKTSAAKTAFA
ncbi:MAG: heme lyase CcmF/NrfE family subunit [Oceanospirillaceae bacterium]|nr:heme lyase CcmF/NrfE family subunit [Oceanospirillaceae bacterium]